jgi:hypothetical protein
MGLENYYTDKDRFPATVTELADGKYVPLSYKNLPITELCYVPGTGPDQTYVATAKSAATGKNFTIVQDATETGTSPTYPDVTATTPCKK